MAKQVRVRIRSKKRVRLNADDASTANDAPVGRNGVSLQRAGRGRPKGTPNKLPLTVKQAFLAAADKHPGGRVGYLFKISKTHPAVFVQCLARMLPTQVKVEQDPNSIFMQALAAVRAREQAPQVLAGVGAYSYSQPRTNASGVGDPAIIDVTPETPDEQG